jgi:hypothetical protein
MLFLGGRHNSISHIGMVSLMQFPSKLKAVLELEIQRRILSPRAPWNMIHITILVLFYRAFRLANKHTTLSYLRCLTRLPSLSNPSA